MKTIRVAEYKYTGKPLNWAISAWTGLFNPGTPRYSHTEIWIPDENGLFGGYDGHLHGGYEGQYFGECFTSTMRGDWNGTVIRPASEVLTHSRRWDYFELEVEDVDYKEAVHLARVAAANNDGYDSPGLVSFFLPIRFGSGTKDICSEVALDFLRWCGIFTKDKMPSPRRLAAWIMQLGFKPIPLLSDSNRYHF